jgi:hypothetical protein
MGHEVMNDVPLLFTRRVIDNFIKIKGARVIAFNNNAIFYTVFSSNLIKIIF